MITHVIGTTLKVNGKTDIRPRHPKTLPKLAGVTTSGISTAVHNGITIRLGNFAPPPHICDVAYQMFTRVGSLGSSNSLPLGRCADFDDQYVKRRQFTQGCAFWGPENKILHFNSIFTENAKFWSIFDGTENFRSKGDLTWDFVSKHP